MACGCRSGCNTNRCSCKKVSRECTDRCQCLDCTNRPTNDKQVAIVPRNGKGEVVVRSAAGQDEPLVVLPDQGDDSMDVVPSLSSLSSTQLLAQETIRRIVTDYDTDGRVRRTTMEQIERKAAQISVLEQTMNSAALDALRSRPDVQQTIQAGATLEKAVAIAMLREWADSLLRGQAHSFYADNAAVVISLRDTPHVDRVSGRADIAQLLSLFAPFHFEVAETEQTVEGDRLLIRAHGTVRSTATQMDAPTALTAALNAAVASMAGHFLTHFTRQIACSLHGDSQNVFPILLDELQLG